MNDLLVYLEAQRNIQTAISHMHYGRFELAALNLKMASEKIASLQGYADEEEYPRPETTQTNKP